MGLSLYQSFSVAEWSRLRASTPLTLTEADLADLRGINERLSLGEVTDVYLPLSRLLNLYVDASQGLARASSSFLGTLPPKVPYVIGLAGSVAVGKSTTARVLQALLARWPSHPKVDLVTTDGFLYPNRVLQERGLMQRKGFPESYDVTRLLAFLAALKSGEPEVQAPVYSHQTYDIVPDRMHVVRRPDIVIVEGLNVLQRGTVSGGPSVFVSDFFDYSLYVDAEEALIEQWYLSRFMALRATAFRETSSYFHRYASLSEEEAKAFAQQVWRTINRPNLAENILPTREQADLILVKGPNHAVQEVRLRKV